MLGSLDSIEFKPERSGYEFIGWFTHPIDGVQVNQYTNVTPTKFNENYVQTYYAHWKEVYCTLKFVTNNGRTIPPVSIRHGRAFSDFVELTKYGYDFLGWKIDGDSKIFKSSDSLVVERDLTFQAQFTPIEYNITYDIGEYGEPSPDFWETYTIESEDYSIPNPITKTQYEDKFNFDGWWKRGKRVTEIPHGSTGDIELIGKWQKME